MKNFSEILLITKLLMTIMNKYLYVTFHFEIQFGSCPPCWFHFHNFSGAVLITIVWVRILNLGEIKEFVRQSSQWKHVTSTGMASSHSVCVSSNMLCFFSPVLFITWKLYVFLKLETSQRTGTFKDFIVFKINILHPAPHNISTERSLEQKR